MYRRRNNQTGEAGRGSAPPDPPGVLANDNEHSGRQRVRRCWWQPRRVLIGPEAVCLRLLHVTLALALILAMSKASLITWAGIRGLRGSVEEGGVDPVSNIEDHFLRNMTQLIERTGSGAVKAEAATEEETVDSAATNVNMSTSGLNDWTASSDITLANGTNDNTELEFVHIPMCGGSSVEFAGAKVGIAWGVCQFNVKMRGCDPLSTEFNHLAPMRDGSEWKCEISTAPWHCPPARYKSGKNPFDGRKTFTVVRSPYDIVLSEYRWAHRKSVTREQLSSVDYMNHWVQDNIKYVIANGSAEGGGHLIPQHVYTHDAEGSLLVDHLLRQDHLTEEFSQLMNQYNLSANLSHYNPRETETIGVEDFTDETVKFINEWAELDFRYLGFEMLEVGDSMPANETRVTDQIGENGISSGRNSKQAKEIRGSGSPAKSLLVADFKWTEGVNAQLHTLCTFLAVANATDRELLLVPFRSDHYVNPKTGRADHYIRMEDYFDNSPGAWPGWRTADPHDGSAPDIVRSLLQWRGYPNINQTVEESKGIKGCVHARVITSLRPWKVAETPLEDVVKTINAVPGGDVACVVGRTGRSKETPYPGFFGLSSLLRKLSQRSLAAIRAGAALTPDAKLSAVHLRRGDKCGRDLDAVGKVRCGPAAGMPFMNLCAELREKGGGLYVATDEEDHSFLEALRDGGCFVRQDLGIDFVAEAEAANDERGGSWRSVHPQALEFVTEMIILRHAEEFYTMGGHLISSSLASIGKYRARHGLSKPRVFGDNTTMAVATSGSAHLTKNNGPVARRGDSGKNHTELVVQQKNNRKIRFQTTHKMGSLALSSFLRKHFSDIEDLIILSMRVKPYAEEPTVVVVRDMFDATVSGYLYHKTGRECWLDHNGRPNPVPRKKRTNDWLLRLNWTKIVLKVPVPENIRSLDLCHALNSTDETIGIGIYLEFAREQFYRSISKLKSRTKDPTLFVCYDDILSDGGRVQTERRIRSFIGQTLNASATSGDKLRRRLNLAGHSTDPDPVLRARLRDNARNIDCAYFGCETTAWNDALEECTTMAASISSGNGTQSKEKLIDVISDRD